ncbi:MAG: hypothetical protein NTZ32_09590 [Planctomycetales bacterium]|nr:hypothetical protein [Planctomycetales bacterium]
MVADDELRPVRFDHQFFQRGSHFGKQRHFPELTLLAFQLGRADTRSAAFKVDVVPPERQNLGRAAQATKPTQRHDDTPLGIWTRGQNAADRVLIDERQSVGPFDDDGLVSLKRVLDQ